MERWAGAVTVAFEANVLTVVPGADVFVDATFAELLHWTEGAPALMLRAGANAVRRFAASEQCSPGAQRAVFLLAEPLTDSTTTILHDLVKGRDWRRVLIFCAVSPQGNALAANPVNPDDPSSIFPRLASRVAAWACGDSGRRCEVDVRHLPLVCAPILPRLWMLPEPRASTVHRDWVTVDRLNSLMEALKVREEIFAVGRAANTLATDLVNYGPAKARRKGPQARACLILVERALDLVSVASAQPGFDSPLDTVFRRLPAFTDEVRSDVGVDLRPLARTADRRLLPVGCLASGDRKLLHRAAVSKQKELLVDLYRRLMESAAEEGLDLGLDRVPSRISADMVEEAVRAFRSCPTALTRHAALLQLSLATAAAAGRREGPSSTSARQSRAEKTLVQAAGGADEQEALLVSTLHEEEEAKERTLSFEEAVAFAAYGLSLIGPDHELAEESWSSITVSLTHLLCEEIHIRHERATARAAKQEALETEEKEDEEEEEEEEDDEEASVLLETLFPNSTPDEDGAPAAVQALTRRLRAVQTARAPLKEWSAVVDTEVVPRYRPLVGSVARHCVGGRPKAGESDLAYLSTGLRDLLKSSLSYFVHTSTPHPSDVDGPLLLVLLGPTSWAEYHAVVEAADAAPAGRQLGLVCCGGVRRGPRDIDLLLPVV